ncbi:MAG TPA: DegT/DnrJ/EryC1/StrS family aminotransferase [Ignavibacteria bacterium]|nr:DegT/DnrJ/EryC1/StrS family aminotransferase [Ignavibacteria bacterium]HQY51151.1 DegT/DnrJ/EryC1/StrS family aminotransferase [Ignavibacteria bacterium]HRA99003.1 DegT/DnrJ/EryC1/StrS family aminotransferase [Ignavibacteria bacterium]
MTKLALTGGTPVRTKIFPQSNTIGEEEKKAVMKVLDSGNLSQYVGTWNPDFYGGPMVKVFEKNWADAFGVDYCMAVNSNTSGLYACMGACDIGPGDEVIVSPYTMTAGAIAPLIYGAVPIFADIDEDTFCLDPKSIEANITPRTKAILLVHILGHPSDMDEIMAIAKKHNLKVIEDCAQSPMSTYKGKLVGTIGDVGVFSLNYHKHIHTGEGGMIVTNDPVIAEKIQLIRNHGEAVVAGKKTKDIKNIFGFNYRMTEMEAAVGTEQLKKLPGLIEKRIEYADYLSGIIGKLPGITPPLVKEGCKHVYYLQTFKFNKEIIGIHRNTFVDALRAELPTMVLRENSPIIGCGFAAPLYLQPLYQQRLNQCSFNCPRYEGNVSYEKGICPVTERMFYDEVFTHEFMRPSFSKADLEDVVNAYQKVYENVNELKEYESKNSVKV